MLLLIVQEASFVGVVRTILIFMLVYYGLKLIAKYIFPLLLKSFIQKQAKKGGFGQFKQEAKQQKEGSVHIDSLGKNQQKADKNIGEYTNYEEID